MIDFKKTTEVQAARVKLLENRAWYEEHLDEILNDRQNKDQVLAVWNKSIVERAPNSDQLWKKIEGKYPKDEVCICMGSIRLAQTKWPV